VLGQEDREQRVVAPTGSAWEYCTVELDELTELGAIGWEAVGVFVLDNSPRALLKRQPR